MLPCRTECRCAVLCAAGQGCIGGLPVVIKQFMQERRGAVAAYERELAAYKRLDGTGLPGTVTPHLLRYGMFEHTGALFLALSDEGTDLATTLQGQPAGAISDQQRQQMTAAIRALHR